ncbi:MAG: 5'-3' exonuclease H3TH domain-containing protein [Myxococcota bacterium]
MVVLIDALSLLYRTHGGEGGFGGAVDRLIAAEQANGAVSVAIALDGPGPTRRRRQFPAYKAGRPPTPDRIRAAITTIPAQAAARGIPVHQVDGEEADDVLATLARLVPGPARIVTNDTDLHQLVDPRVTVRTIDGRIVDAAALQARFPFPPSLLPTFKAMIGDPADNLPGITGLGRPTASRLCRDHGDAAAILAALDAGRIGNPRVRPILDAARDALVLQETLGRLDPDLPLSPPWTGSPIGGLPTDGTRTGRAEGT